MSNTDVQIFTNKELNADVRVIRLNGESDDPWFVASDVAKVLDYSETSVMIRRMDDDETYKIAPTLIAGTSNMSRDITIISESGLYNAILGSKKPEAKKFKKWVTSEVLPSIRKTGGFVSNDDLFVESYFGGLDDSHKELLKGLLQNVRIEQEKNKQLTTKIEQDKPLVDFANQVSNSSDCIDVGTFAKVVKDEHIKLGRNKLFAWLRDNKYVRNNKNNEPYQRFIDMGLFKVIEQTYKTPYGQQIAFKTLVTPKGQIYFIQKLKDEFGVTG